MSDDECEVMFKLKEACGKNLPMFQLMSSEVAETLLIKASVCTGPTQEHKCEAFGSGPTNKKAKRNAAENLLQKIYADLALPAPKIEEPCDDHLGVLLGYCIENDLSMPKFKEVESEDETSHIMSCTVGNIVRYSKACVTLKEAKQNAALNLLTVLYDVQQVGSGLVTLDESLTDDLAKRNYYINLYLSSKGIKNVEGIKLSDRHNYFKRLDKNRVAAALKIIKEYDKEEDSAKQTVWSVCQALDIKFKSQKVPDEMNMVSWELELTNFDCFFMHYEPDVWSDIIKYFSIMLV